MLIRELFNDCTDRCCSGVQPYVRILFGPVCVKLYDAVGDMRLCEDSAESVNRVEALT